MPRIFTEGRIPIKSWAPKVEMTDNYLDINK